MITVRMGESTFHLAYSLCIVFYQFKFLSIPFLLPFSILYVDNSDFVHPYVHCKLSKKESDIVNRNKWLLAKDHFHLIWVKE